MTSRIQQTEVFQAAAADIYELLTDSIKFSEMTGGAPAEIDPSDGGGISLFGGMITGRTIEAVQNQRVVQAWRPQPWDAGVYSIVRFEIVADGETATVSLDHTGFPEGEGEHLAQGWQDNYWSNMRAAISG
ncbi:MAG: SRPBCC domain-containing protein [Actinomycetota bacterium]